MIIQLRKLKSPGFPSFCGILGFNSDKYTAYTMRGFLGEYPYVYFVLLVGLKSYR